MPSQSGKDSDLPTLEPIYADKYQIVSNYNAVFYLRDTHFNDGKLANFYMQECSFDIATK